MAGFIAIVLALFVLVSLITALIINSLAINYVNSRFSNHMDRYASSQNSRGIIDRIQTKYICCGSNTWLEWTRVTLNVTTTTTPTPAANTTVTTTLEVNTTTTTTTAAATEPITTTVTPSATTTPLFGTTVFETIQPWSTVSEEGAGGKRMLDDDPEITSSAKTINHIETVDNRVERSFAADDTEQLVDDFYLKQNLAQETIRHRRQVQTNNGGIQGLPSTFVVTLPQSCCTSDLSSINSLSNPCKNYRSEKMKNSNIGFVFV